MRILITGAGGMLGHDVRRAAIQDGHDTVSLTRAQLDVTDRAAVADAVGGAGADVVINCAAWTNVDGAESESGQASAVNGDGAGHVAATAAAAGAWVIHVSTDYVFDGSKSSAYVESDPVGPMSAYGRSKLAGERAVAEAAPDRHTIVRTAWLFGAGGRCFPKTILRAASERPELAVVADQIGCPTFTGHLAGALLALAARRTARDPARRRTWAVLLARVRDRDRGRGRSGLSGAPHHHGGLSRARAPAGQQRPDLRARRARAARLARRAGPVHVRAGRGGGVKLLVCGAAGFIGSTFVELRVREHGDEVTVLDALTYAGREENLRDVQDEIRFVQGEIQDPEAVASAIGDAEAIVNFAAETHVDRSIADPFAFSVTNGQGTHVLLEAARERGLRYVQVSTDEVYGSIETGSFTETSPLQPSSPYSATKTGADLLVLSYFHTYGLETVVARGSNNYGPRQYPEKLIPLMILNALAGDHLPVYGDGRNVRNWLYVEDFGRGIGHVLAHGKPGEVYNCGGPDECENIEVVHRILELTGADDSLIEYVIDRPGHDRRYSLSSDKLAQLGWRAQTRFAEGLERTVTWYRENAWWWEPIRSGAYRDYYERHYGRSLK